MSNYEYANGTGLSVLSQQIFEHLTPLVESVKVFFLASYDRENPPKIGKYIENEDGNSIWATEDNSIFAMEPWSDTPPERLPGMYLWTYTEAIFKDGSVYNSDPVCMVTWDDIDNAVSGMTASLEAGLALKADKATTYTKTEVDTSLAAKSDKATTYTKSDVDAIVNTDDVTSEAANPLVIETAAAQTAKSTVIEIEPIQDLHGYDHPWPAGGGKNKAAFVNSGTIVNGITFTVNKDSDGNVISFTANGTASARASIALCDVNLPAGTYVLNGNPSGSDDTYWIVDSASAFLGKVHGGNSRTATVPEGQRVLLLFQVEEGVTVTNATVYPMIRLASISDATFAPYSNICPISGLDEVTVERTGKNLFSYKSEIRNGYWDSTSFVGDNNVVPLENATGWQHIKIPVKEGLSYSISNMQGQGGTNCAFIGSEDPTDIISLFLSINMNRTISAPSGARYMCLCFYNLASTHTDFPNAQVELGSTATDYEPYQKFDAEVDLPTTIYGGTLNLETGELVVDWKKIKLRDLSIPDRTATYFYSSTTTDKAYGAAKVKCSCYKTVDVSAGDMPECSIKGNGGNSYLYITDTRFSTGAELKNALGDQDIAYELATPITYHLTPSQLDLLKGTNVITVNGKTIQVTYREGSLATLEEVNEVSDALVSEECTSPEGNPVTIETDAAQYAKATHLTLAPVQDLHGYDHPWPAGGGKNLLPMTVDGIKAANTSGTWSGNAYTINGITCTIRTDSDENVIGINVNGSANSTAFFGVAITLPSGNYIFNGCPQNGASNTYRVDIREAIGGLLIAEGYDTGSGNALQLTEDTTCYYNIRIESGYNAQNLLFKPMIRLSSVSDDTFAPYSNICPITPMGHRNLLQVTAQSQTINGVTFTINPDGTIRVNGTANSQVNFAIATTFPLSGSYVVNGCPKTGTSSTYSIETQKAGAWSGSDYGTGATFTLSEEILTPFIVIRSGYTANNLVFKPMLRPASDPDSTFVPYGMARVGAKVTGKNLIDPSTFIAVYAGPDSIDSDGYISDSTPSSDSRGWAYNSSNFKLTLKAGTYTLLWENAIPSSSDGYGLHLYTEDSTVIVAVNSSDAGSIGVHSVVFSLNEDCTVGLMAKVYDARVRYAIYPKSDSSIEYEPFKCAEVGLDLPEEIYSGTLDLETGVVVVDRANGEITSSSDVRRNYVGNIGTQFLVVNVMSGAKTDGIIIANNLEQGSHTIPWHISYSTATNIVFNLPNDVADTLEEAIAWLANNPIHFVYELATPITYQLTPQQLALFKGINNISSNAKTVQVTYRNGELATTGDIVASTEVAKQNAIGESASYTDARLATELAPILGDLATAETSPASASHAVGEYLLYNKRLYKVLAAISAGQQLTIGTNIGQTNVAAELASQASVISALNSNSLFYRSPTVTSITSDTDLWNMGTGIYLISLSSASEYIPTKWGILIVFSCITDTAYFYMTTFGESYLRIAYNLQAGTPAWRYDWKRIDNS